MATTQAIPITWNALQQKRPGVFKHPESKSLVSEAWNHFSGSGSSTPSFDDFATWLCVDANWTVFTQKFETAAQIPLTAEYKLSPSSLPLPPAPVTAVPQAQQVQSGFGEVLSPAPTKTGTLPPWLRPAPQWAPANLFHIVTESAILEIGLRGYDILTNIIGLPILATQMGMGTLNVAHWIVFIVGAVVISFIEVFALGALARAIEVHNSQPTGDKYMDVVRRFAIGVFITFFIMGMLLWVVDLYLSILPWAMLFNGNPIGWLVGGVLSLLAEYVEIDGHLKTFKNFSTPAKATTK